MKRYELESLLKSFGLFFVSMGVFLGVIFYLEYRGKRTDLDQRLFTQMRLCSFDLKCPAFQIDFTPKVAKKPLFLYHERGDIAAYFPLPGSNAYFMKLSYPRKRYLHDLHRIRKQIVMEYLFSLLFVALLSLLFSFYALYPMKRAITTIEEFIRDILHDFNTPISAIVLNSALLHKDSANAPKIERIEKSARRILDLQENLRYALHKSRGQEERFALRPLVEETVDTVQKLHPELTWQVDIGDLKLRTNRSALQRILNNLITNAAIYNKEHGRVCLYTQGQKLIVEDSGIGIQNPKRVFERFYTETPRGTGLGLHIVKKLCDEMRIPIDLESVPGEGSRFLLDMRSVTVR